MQSCSVVCDFSGVKMNIRSLRLLNTKLATLEITDICCGNEEQKSQSFFKPVRTDEIEKREK